MSTYLASKHADFIASIPAPPVMPICHGPSDLNALAKHIEDVSWHFTEYLFSLAREAQSLNVPTNPMDVAKSVRDTIHDCDLAQSIRNEAEMMVERSLEDA